MRRNDFWLTPPGGTRTPRRVAKTLITSFVVGVLSIGMAWAGAGLVPVSVDGARNATDATDAIQSEEGDGAQAAAVPQLDLSGGEILAGAEVVSIEPRPGDYAGEWVHAEWETPEQKKQAIADAKAKCELHGPVANSDNPMHTFQDVRVRWAENPSCIYMGGYGIGPLNSIVAWDEEYGLAVRSFALSDGQDTLVLTILDGAYYFAEYASMCNEDSAHKSAFEDEGNEYSQDCGWFDLQKSIAGQLGIDPEGLFFSSSHSHTAPDFVGAWGGVPKWYMQQVEDSIRLSVRNAVTGMQPAVLEGGEVLVRNRNHERRRLYRSAEENGLVWLRAIATQDMPKPAACPTPTPAPQPTTGNNGNGNGNGYGNQGKETPSPAPTPTCEPAQPGKAIATLGGYAAHPVTVEASDGIGDADFPAVFEKKVEEFGGVGLFFQTGLGNISPDGEKDAMGEGLAAAIPPIGAGTRITAPDGGTPNVRYAQDFWNQPVTNAALGSGGAGGIFDRPMNRVDPEESNPQDHASVSFSGKHFARKCTSTSPIWAHTSVSAAKVGPVAILGGPGETFSNLSNTLKEQNPNGLTLPLALVNDGLGYVMQSFEMDLSGHQAVGFVSGEAGDITEYEDAYAIDRCFGDAVLERSIALLGQL